MYLSAISSSHKRVDKKFLKKLRALHNFKLTSTYKLINQQKKKKTPGSDESIAEMIHHKNVCFQCMKKRNIYPI